MLVDCTTDGTIVTLVTFGIFSPNLSVDGFSVVDLDTTTRSSDRIVLLKFRGL